MLSANEDSSFHHLPVFTVPITLGSQCSVVTISGATDAVGTCDILVVEQQVNTVNNKSSF